MISIYNKAIVRELNPELLDRLEKIEKEKRSSRLETAKNGEDCLVVQSHDREYYITSRYHPSHEAEKLIDSYLDVNQNDSVVFYGVGLGYHIKEALERWQGIKYFLMEPNLEVLYRFLEKNELKDWPLKDLGGIESDYEGMHYYLREFGRKHSRRIRCIALKGYISFFPQDYEHFLKEYVLTFRKARDVTNALVTVESHRALSSVRNTARILEEDNLFWLDKTQFQGKTAVLVAAGPSLDEEIENLRQIKKRKLASIFTAGSAVNALISKNIYPEATFSYDPTPENSRVLQEIKDRKITDIPLIFGSGVGHESLQGYPGQAFSVFAEDSGIHRQFLVSKHKELPEISLGSTISVLAINCLAALGFTRIILVGQNLGVKGQRSYSSGIRYIHPEETISMDQYTESVKDVYGNQMKTASVYLVMLKDIEIAIADLPAEVKVYNATKGGSNIRGAEFKELELLMQEMSDNSSVFFGKEKTGESYDIPFLEKQLQTMKLQRDDLERYITNYENILKEIKAVFPLKQYGKLQKIYTKLNLALKRLESNIFSQLFVLPPIEISYYQLVQKIEYLNEIVDPKEKAEQIYSEFYKFVKDYKAQFQTMKKEYGVMENILTEYAANRKQG